jgi:hypothetical protein
MRCAAEGPFVAAAVTNNADAIRGLLADGHPPDSRAVTTITRR